ncbi:hypothetical protein [Actinoplanes regularis]|uniref:hypothetical protein n=1 Tax=Actinoplanes regularis TaxID=52697 RepID=UPI0024A5A50C|nr:hypothetical protein [Actinoplanes regularis]GLW32300.1 hypothetical protein Areg01_52390 [Actinoplanes regularis]
MKHVNIRQLGISFDVELPRVGRRRGICTGVLCSLASGLWLSAPAIGSQVPLLPDADLSGLLILSGLSIPAAVGWVTLLLMEARILRDLRPAEQHSQPERAEKVPAR